MSPNPPPQKPAKRARASRSFRLGKLPENIQKKIKLEVEGKETGCCWLWTGGTRKARQREKRYRTPADLNHYRGKISCVEVERATPEVRDPRKGDKAAAHRVIYGWLTGVYIDDVPELERCHSPLCVSPYHVKERGPTAPQRRRLKEQKAEPLILKPVADAVPLGMTDEEVLDLLKKHRPFEGSDDLEQIEDDYEIPRGKLTLDIWKAYLAWAVENPDEWDEEERRDAVG